MGVVDSNMVVEHDSRRKPLGVWDGARLPTSTEPVAIGSHAEPRQSRKDAFLHHRYAARLYAPGTGSARGLRV